MRKIRLRNSDLFAMVSTVDFERLKKFDWYVFKPHGGSRTYAARTIRTADGARKSLMHWEILGKEDGLAIRHIDHNGLNNRRGNLSYSTWNPISARLPKQVRKAVDEETINTINDIFRDAIVSILMAFSKGKHHQLSELTKEGLQQARLRGEILGRPRREISVQKIRQLRREGNSWREIAKLMDASSATVYYRNQEEGGIREKLDPSFSGRELAEKRKAAGLTQHSLAQKAGISLNKLVFVETGRTVFQPHEASCIRKALEDRSQEILAILSKTARTA